MGEAEVVALTIMRGASGSGKTTLAKTLPGVRISRDYTRAELTGRTDKFVGGNTFESRVTKIERDRVRAALVARRDVVVDDTNLTLKFAREWANMANDYGAEFKVIDLKVDLDTLLSRSDIPAEVVTRQFKRACWGEVVADADHPFVDWSPLRFDPDLPTIVTCDLDGTLSILPDGYSPYDPHHYRHDGHNPSVGAVLNQFPDATIHFLSGRDESGRVDTEYWLGLWGYSSDNLHMRKAGDKRRDDTVKVEMVNEHIRGKYNIVFHLDDRQRVVDALRAIGITVFQVAPGDF